MRSRKVCACTFRMRVYADTTDIGHELLGKLRKMRMLADDDDEATPSAGPSQGASQQPAWMRNLNERCREWLEQLPAVSSRKGTMFIPGF